MTHSGCETCPAHNAGNLKRLGINMDDFDYVVALAGNPNTGKSTVFNNLTGLKQRTGNWPGKTVGRAEGGFEFDGKKFKLVDLPGTYSLLSTSADEEVARDFILFAQPDVTVVVIDATRLERNLNLTLQIREITGRVVVCLNLMDEARRRGIKINRRALAKKLGVPVVPAEARQNKGMKELIQTISEVAAGKIEGRALKLGKMKPKLKKAVAELALEIEKAFPNLPNSEWAALRLLEGDQSVIDAVKSGELGNLSKETGNAIIAEESE